MCQLPQERTVLPCQKERVLEVPHLPDTGKLLPERAWEDRVRAVKRKYGIRRLLFAGSGAAQQLSPVNGQKQHGRNLIHHTEDGALQHHLTAVLRVSALKQILRLRQAL